MVYTVDCEMQSTQGQKPMPGPEPPAYEERACARITEPISCINYCEKGTSQLHGETSARCTMLPNVSASIEQRTPTTLQLLHKVIVKAILTITQHQRTVDGKVDLFSLYPCPVIYIASLGKFDLGIAHTKSRHRTWSRNHSLN